MNIFRVLLEECRPKQWIKNSLVIVAPLTSKTLFESSTLVSTIAVFCSMCAVSSATYFLNDVRDREADAQHAKKKRRPIASGRLSVRTAYIGIAVLLSVGLAMAALVSNESFLVVVAYLSLTTAYSFRLKHVPIVEIVIVASGFVIRAFLGAIAAEVPPSSWFMASIFAGSLFVATRKRYAEKKLAHSGGMETRRVLNSYSLKVLSVGSQFLSACFVLAYIAWCAEVNIGGSGALAWRLVSAVPLCGAVIRYQRQSEGEIGESPEDLLTEDRAIKIWGVFWIIAVVLSLYAG
jgi:decaprenyl-phosphate phosphoribosyltransferase